MGESFGEGWEKDVAKGGSEEGRGSRVCVGVFAKCERISETEL